MVNEVEFYSKDVKNLTAKDYSRKNLIMIKRILVEEKYLINKFLEEINVTGKNCKTY
jgi:hypothetical protein